MRPLILALLCSWVSGAAPGALRAQDTPPALLMLVLTANDSADTTLPRGWPLLVQAEMVLMDTPPAPVVLDPATARLEIATADGGTVTGSLQPAAGFDVRPTLDDDHVAAALTWMMPAAQTSVLAVGEYRIRVSWAGTQAVARLVVTAPPATLSAVDDERLARLQARAAQLAGDPDAALAVVTRATERHPDSVGLWVLLASLHEQRGAPSEAYRAVRQAIERHAQSHPDATHPPGALLKLEDRLFLALLEESRARPRPAVPAAAPTATPAPAADAFTAPVAPPPVATATVPSPPPPTEPPRTASPPPAGVLVPSSELDEAAIIADPRGQWASGAVAGTQYSSPNYGAAKMTGPPDVPKPGDHVDAWCHASGSATSDWIELTFASPARATEVRVRQTNCPGTITRVEAIAPDGTVHLWWEGADPFRATYQNTLAWFAVRVSATEYAVAKVRITLNLAAVPGWKQIDAVQLVRVDEP